MSDTRHDDPSTDTDRVVPDGLYHPDDEWGDDPRVRALSFAPAVAERHRRFDADEYDDVYVVGDVHGCVDELRALWRELSPSDDDLVVFVGDLVRKGPDSVGAVEFVARRENAVSVLGNNEAKVLDGRVDPAPFRPVREHVAEFPLVVSWGDAVALHGGLHPSRPLDDHDAEDVLETRSVPPGNGYDGPFWFERYAGPPRAFFGHTVLADPLVGEWAVGLDTGCVYGGRLTAYHCDSGELTAVPAERTYEERDASKVIDPARVDLP